MATSTIQFARLLENQQRSERQIAELSLEAGKLLLQSSANLGVPNFKSIGTGDLQLLFNIIDALFLDGQLMKTYNETAPSPLKFRLSKRMVNTGGTTTMFTTRNKNSQRNAAQSDFEIAIATTPLFQTFANESSAVVSGVKCTNRVEALQRVMEHEMIHLAEFLCWDDSNCHRQRFRSIVRRFFGHTESNHQLLNHRANAKLLHDIRIGDRVAFRNGNDMIHGCVNRITKRASVLVPDRKGQKFSDGNYYSTYYVPIRQLRKVS